MQITINNKLVSLHAQDEKESGEMWEFASAYLAMKNTEVAEDYVAPVKRGRPSLSGEERAKRKKARYMKAYYKRRKKAEEGTPVAITKVV